MKFRHFIAAALAVTASVAGVPASAVSITTKCGPTICYTYDEDQSAADPSLMGLPTLVGDSMRFLPTNFIAESNGSGFVTETATFVFDRIYTIGGEEIIGITVVEQGDYEIINGGSVRANLYLRADSNVVATDSTVLSPIASFNSSGDSGGLQSWTLSGSLAPASAFTGLANDMAVQIQDTLRANALSDPDNYAFIQKKFTLTVTTVPVPAAVWLLGSAIGLLGVLRRRQSAQI